MLAPGLLHVCLPGPGPPGKPRHGATHGFPSSALLADLIRFWGPDLGSSSRWPLGPQVLGRRLLCSRLDPGGPLASAVRSPVPHPSSTVSAERSSWEGGRFEYEKTSHKGGPQPAGLSRAWRLSVLLTMTRAPWGQLRLQGPPACSLSAHGHQQMTRA